MPSSSSALCLVPEQFQCLAPTSLPYLPTKAFLSILTILCSFFSFLSCCSFQFVLFSFSVLSFLLSYNYNYNYNHNYNSTTLGYTPLHHTTRSHTTLHYNYNYTNNYSYNYNYNTTTTTISTTATTTTTLHYSCKCNNHYNYITLHYTTLITSSSCGWGDHCSHSKKHNCNHLSVHQWIPCITTTHLSYSFLSLKLAPPLLWYYWYSKI